MPNLILIKHAPPLVEPDVPADRWRLSERGRELCGPLAEKLRSYEPAIVVSSEEPKAQQTAQLVAERLEISWKTAANLHEHDRRNVPHLRSGEFISMVELMLRKRDELVLGSESADQALNRFRHAVRDVDSQHLNENVAIVAHGTVIAMFVAEHTRDHTAFELWRKLGLPSFVVMSRPELRVETIVERIES